jgi:nitroreductase
LLVRHQAFLLSFNHSILCFQAHHFSRITMTQSNQRQSEFPIDALFLNRWSPRAFTQEAISEEQLMTLFEAAHWAPSSYNSQPWRFIYGRRGTPHFDKLLGLLIERNQAWAKNAAALAILVSSSTMSLPGQEKPVPSHSHSLDAGAAWVSFALQATLAGWQAHGMVGFDMQRAAAELNIPDGYRVEMALAVGRPGDKSTLSPELAARETPNTRQPLKSVVMEGAFRSA